MASALSAVLQGRYTAHRTSHRRFYWSTRLVREFDCEAKDDAGRFRKAVEANRHDWLECGSTSRLPGDGLRACPRSLGVGYQSAVAAGPFVLSRPDAYGFAGSAGAASPVRRCAQPR